jgi:hypothetical protein
MGFIGTWTGSQPFTDPVFNDSPWMLPGDVSIDSTIGKVFGFFWLLSLLGFIVAGIGLVANQPWWTTVAIAALILPIIAVVPWWNTFTPGIMSKTSAVVVDIIALVSLLGPWKDQILGLLGTE